MIIIKMRVYNVTYSINEPVLYYGERCVIVEIKTYSNQTDFVIKMGNGKLVQVEDWKVEKTS